MGKRLTLVVFKDLNDNKLYLLGKPTHKGINLPEFIACNVDAGKLCNLLITQSDCEYIVRNGIGKVDIEAIEEIGNLIPSEPFRLVPKIHNNNEVKVIRDIKDEPVEKQAYNTDSCYVRDEMAFCENQSKEAAQVQFTEKEIISLLAWIHNNQFVRSGKDTWTSSKVYFGAGDEFYTHEQLLGLYNEDITKKFVSHK